MFITVDDVQAMIPAFIKRTIDQYGLVMTDDEAICVLRAFKWDAERMVESWYDNESKLKKKLGIEFDKTLNKDKTISASLAENNGGCCIVCYGSFDEAIKTNDKDGQSLSLSCGH